MNIHSSMVLEAMREAEGPVSATVLARRTGTPVATVKTTLRYLEREGVVRRDRAGSWSPTG